MPGVLWTPGEDVIAFYFISREFHRCSEVASQVIEAKCGSTRAAATCRGHVKQLRGRFWKKYGLNDPYDENTNKYDLVIVGKWLSRQMDEKTLERVLGVKDGKIMDKEVQDIVDKEV